MKLAILGATGSIGQSALDLAEHFPDYIEITALTCGRNVELLARAILRHRPALVAVHGPEERAALERLLTEMGLAARPAVLCGEEGLVAAAAESGAEVVLSAIVGGAGLIPTFAAARAGLKLAIANKETLVMAGDLLMPLAARAGAEIVPVDSEHSAIFQILGGLRSPSVRRLILTASGGPFRGLTVDDLERVTIEEALNHPRWVMGPKITCDSATMMNKGLEIIEAHHLFGLAYDQLEVLIHPQSVVHSIVEYQDGAQLMQAGPTDMRQAIAYALSVPDRWPLLPDGSTGGLPNYRPVDLPRFAFNQWRGHLTFEEPDFATFRALRLAEGAGRTGGTAPTILCSANEEAVELFLAGAVGFADIARLVEQTLNALPARPLTSVEQALNLRREARRLTKSFSLDLRR
ncbi:MAG: 1-deoxy-D-xylulose-5-phosphate reductoisomerase [Candidatus Adiutrix sp.]|jgi:1-deoxy-D-xylulose-5-phosphate reductoisomerase|nr:1-deoxy-D-xylulose-5-phosphate reductoisomerase [Candidatus Adiutrix sp.]